MNEDPATAVFIAGIIKYGGNPEFKQSLINLETKYKKRIKFV